MTVITNVYYCAAGCCVLSAVQLVLTGSLYTGWCVTGLMDAVHKAAFRGSLGRSLYMNPDRVGTYSTKAVSHFAASV